jgi:hypothetical protein
MGLHDNAIVAQAETKVMKKSDRNVWVLMGEILELLLDKFGFLAARPDFTKCIDLVFLRTRRIGRGAMAASLQCISGAHGPQPHRIQVVQRSAVRRQIARRALFQSARPRPPATRSAMRSARLGSAHVNELLLITSVAQRGRNFVTAKIIW